MKKSDILAMNDSELFCAFYGSTMTVVKEANSTRGESKKSLKEFEWVVDECVKRFNLDKDVLIERHVLDKQES